MAKVKPDFGVDGERDLARGQAVDLGQRLQLGHQLLERQVLDLDGRRHRHLGHEREPAVDGDEVVEEAARQVDGVAAGVELEVALAEEHLAHLEGDEREDAARHRMLERAAEVHVARERAGERNRHLT